MMSDAQGVYHYEVIKEVKTYIHDNLDKPLHRDQLAIVVGYSVPHLHRLFIASMGVSMSDYIRQLWLKRAGYKLRMGAVNITQVALAAGYQTHAAFGKAFKQQYGLSPSDFRSLSCREATQRLMKGFES
jgi:AraC family transcriptional regulator